MRRLKFFILLGFAIMFVAGLEVGRSHTTIASIVEDWRRLTDRLTGKTQPPPTTQPTRADDRMLFHEIPLTTEQDEQIKKIYHEARTKTDQLAHQFHDLDRQREEEVLSLLTPWQKAEYDDIQQYHDTKVGELHTQIGVVFEKAGDDVRALLTPEQQKKFDQIRRQHAADMRDHGRHGPGPGPGPWRTPGSGPRHTRASAPSDTSPTTAPAPN